MHVGRRVRLEPLPHGGGFFRVAWREQLHVGRVGTEEIRHQQNGVGEHGRKNVRSLYRLWEVSKGVVQCQDGTRGCRRPRRVCFCARQTERLEQRMYVVVSTFSWAGRRDLSRRHKREKRDRSYNLSLWRWRSKTRPWCKRTNRDKTYRSLCHQVLSIDPWVRTLLI